MQSTMLSPFSIQQQQPTMLGQQQSFLMAASARSSVASQRFPAVVYQPWSNGILLPNQNWGSTGHQVPGMMMTVANPQNYMQV
jgi:stromal membrane-associated protein